MLPDPTAETVIRDPDTTMQAIGVCPRCGVRFRGFGVDPVLATEAVADVHDIECADLAAARSLLGPVDDDLAGLDELERSMVADFEAAIERIREAAS